MTKHLANEGRDLRRCGRPPVGKEEDSSLSPTRRHHLASTRRLAAILETPYMFLFSIRHPSAHPKPECRKRTLPSHFVHTGGAQRCLTEPWLAGCALRRRQGTRRPPSESCYVSVCLFPIVAGLPLRRRPGWRCSGRLRRPTAARNWPGRRQREGHRASESLCLRCRHTVDEGVAALQAPGDQIVDLVAGMPGAI